MRAATTTAASALSSRSVRSERAPSRAVLFDLDGVIVDSREQHMAAWEAWGRTHAPEARAGYFLQSFGLRNDAIIGALFPGMDAAHIERLAAAKEAHFRRLAAGRLVALDGVRDLLDGLEARAISRAIVTSTPRENLDMVLGALAIEGRFQALVAGEDTARGKPDPEGYLLAAERLAVPPGSCTVIEDAPAGLRAAKAAGMRAIGVTTTHPATELRDADLIVNSLKDPRVLDVVLS